MKRHRITLQFDGETWHGVAFRTEAELDAYEAGCRGLVQTSAIVPAASAQAADDEPQPRGRPSYDSMIAAAIKALRRKLHDCSSLSERARLVLKHLAERHGAQELPAQSTVRAYLAAPPVAKNPADKSAEKSKRARIRRTGGIDA